MSRKLLAAALAASAGVLVLVLRPWATTPIYSYGVRDFLSRDVREQKVRVSGQLVRGSLCRLPAECGYRFAIQGGPSADDGSFHDRESGSTLSVSYDGCALPGLIWDMRGYEANVVVEGERCQSGHDFRATKIFARSSRKYEGRAASTGRDIAPSPPPCNAAQSTVGAREAGQLRERQRDVRRR